MEQNNGNDFLGNQPSSEDYDIRDEATSRSTPLRCLLSSSQPLECDHTSSSLAWEIMNPSLLTVSSPKSHHTSFDVVASIAGHFDHKTVATATAHESEHNLPQFNFASHAATPSQSAAAHANSYEEPSCFGEPKLHGDAFDEYSDSLLTYELNHTHIEPLETLWQRDNKTGQQMTQVEFPSVPRPADVNQFLSSTGQEIETRERFFSPIPGQVNDHAVPQLEWNALLQSVSSMTSPYSQPVCINDTAALVTGLVVGNVGDDGPFHAAKELGRFVNLDCKAASRSSLEAPGLIDSANSQPNLGLPFSDHSAASQSTEIGAVLLQAFPVKNTHAHGRQGNSTSFNYFDPRQGQWQQEEHLTPMNTALAYVPSPTQPSQFLLSPMQNVASTSRMNEGLQPESARLVQVEEQVNLLLQQVQQQQLVISQQQQQIEIMVQQTVRSLEPSQGRKRRSEDKNSSARSVSTRASQDITSAARFSSSDGDRQVPKKAAKSAPIAIGASNVFASHSTLSPFPSIGSATGKTAILSGSVAARSTLLRSSHSPGILLALPLDEHNLSEFQCSLRKQIELFEADKDDIETMTQGRKRKPTMGQVGIRCRHCSSLPFRQRCSGAGYFPGSLAGVYQAAQNMATAHLLKNCSQIPESVRHALRNQRNVKDTPGGGKQYWADACSIMGVFETAEGLRRKRPDESEPHSLTSYK